MLPRMEAAACGGVVEDATAMESRPERERSQMSHYALTGVGSLPAATGGPAPVRLIVRLESNKPVDGDRLADGLPGGAEGDSDA
jgi:hypothetical protein